jgi:hypothetical protein
VGLPNGKCAGGGNGVEAKRAVQWTVPARGKRPSIYGWPWWTNRTLREARKESQLGKRGGLRCYARDRPRLFGVRRPQKQRPKLLNSRGQTPLPRLFV